MNCSQCGDRIIGQPGATGSKSSGGWCGSKRVTRRWVVCQDCTAAGEYQQHLYRQSLITEALAKMTPEQRSRFD